MKSKFVRSITYNTNPISVKTPVANTAIDGMGQLNYLIDSSIKEIIRWANRDFSSSDAHYGERNRYVFNKDTLDFIIERVEPEHLGSLQISVGYDGYGNPWCYTLTKRSLKELKKLKA